MTLTWETFVGQERQQKERQPNALAGRQGSRALRTRLGERPYKPSARDERRQQPPSSWQPALRPESSVGGRRERDEGKTPRGFGRSEREGRPGGRGMGRGEWDGGMKAIGMER